MAVIYSGQAGDETYLRIRHPGQWLEAHSAVLEVDHSTSALTLTASAIYRCEARFFRHMLATSIEANTLLMHLANLLGMSRQHFSFVKHNMLAKGELAQPNPSTLVVPDIQTLYDENKSR